MMWAVQVSQSGHKQLRGVWFVAGCVVCALGPSGDSVSESLTAAEVVPRDPQYGPPLEPSQRAELLNQENDFHINRAAISNSGDRWAVIIEKGQSVYMHGAPERFEVVVWDPSTNVKSTIATIKSDALPHISHPVWSPDDRQIAWATIPERRVTPDEVDPETGLISDTAVKDRTEWSKKRGSKLTVFNVENGKSFSVHFQVEVRELAWGTGSHLFACGYRIGQPYGSPEELCVVDISQEHIQPRYVFRSPERVSHVSLLRGHHKTGSVYFVEYVGSIRLELVKPIDWSGADGERWTLHKAQVTGTEIITSPVVSWEAETKNTLVWPKTISPDGKWVACEATAPPLGAGLGLALFSVGDGKMILIEHETCAQPIGWSPTGDRLYALTPDTINPRPYGKIPRFPARYSLASLLR